MAGTRRGPEGSGLPVRAQTRPQVRIARAKRRIREADDDRDRIGAAADWVRSALSDPHLDKHVAELVAKRTIEYLKKTAEELETAVANSRKAPKQ